MKIDTTKAETTREQKALPHCFTLGGVKQRELIEGEHITQLETKAVFQPTGFLGSLEKPNTHHGT